MASRAMATERTKERVAQAGQTAGPAAKKGRGRPTSAGDEVGREGLLVATREILRTTPPEHVTRLMIAKHAGVDPALIRYYFGTVSHLITEVVVDTHRQIQHSMLNFLSGRHPEEWLRARIVRIIDLFIENPFHHLFIRHVMYDPDNAQDHAEWIGALRVAIDLTTKQIEAGLAAGVFRPVDPRMLHLAMIAVGEFFGANPRVVSDIFKGGESIHTMRDAYVDFVADLFLRGLRRPD